MYKKLLTPLILSLCASAPSSAETSLVQYELLTDELTLPWAVEPLDNERFLITQKPGEIVLFDAKSKSITTLLTLDDIHYKGQGGLFDIALSPTFDDNQQVFISYAKDINGEAATTLATATLSEGTLIDFKDLIQTDSLSSSGYHFGGRISFDTEHVYLTVGDRGDRTQAQNLSNHIGSILRLNLDGSVPSDNPFVTQDHAKPEIYSYGHRNPQGIDFDATTGRLWSNEHGPRGGDEINLIEPGKNYGWPVISYGREYREDKMAGEATSREGMEQPKIYFDPSIATSSLIIYQGELLNGWKGNLYSGALAGTHLNEVSEDEAGSLVETNRYFTDASERVRGLAQDELGVVYFVTDSGKLYRILPAA